MQHLFTLRGSTLRITPISRGGIKIDISDMRRAHWGWIKIAMLHGADSGKVPYKLSAKGDELGTQPFFLWEKTSSLDFGSWLRSITHSIYKWGKIG